MDDFFSATASLPTVLVVMTKVTVWEVILLPVDRLLRPPVAAAWQYRSSMSMSPRVSPAARLASISALI